MAAKRTRDVKRLDVKRQDGETGDAAVHGPQTPLPEPAYIRLAPELLIPTPQNPRRIRKDTPKWREFVASVRALGVQDPVVARPHATEPGKYDLRAGHRRVAAALEVGLADVPVLLYDAMTDTQAMTITVIENLERDDLSPIEEGAGVATLLEEYRGDILAVADRLGRTPHWVAVRARLHKLASAWRENVEDGFARDWTAGMLAQISRLPEAEQLVMLDDNHRYTFERCGTEADVRSALGELLRTLKSAKWKLDDASVTEGRPACDKCTQRSDRHPALFDDLHDPADKAGRCLNGACWQAKQLSWLGRKLEELKAKHGKAVAIDDCGHSRNQAEALAPFVGELKSLYSFEKAKRDDKGAFPALIAMGKRAGSVTWVREYSSGGSGAAKTAGPKTLAEKRAGLESKRWCQVFMELREHVEKAPYTDIKAHWAEYTVVRLAETVGTDDKAWYIGSRDDIWGPINAARTSAPSMADAPGAMERAIEDLWRKVRPVLVARLNRKGGVTQLPTRYIDEARQVADLLGIDVNAILADVSTRKGFLEPKAWAKQEEAEKAAAAEKRKAAKKPKAKAKAAEPAKGKPQAHEEPDNGASELPQEPECPWSLDNLRAEANASDLIGCAFSTAFNDYPDGKTGRTMYFVDEGDNHKWRTFQKGMSGLAPHRAPAILAELRDSKAEAERLLAGYAVLSGWDACCRVCGHTETDRKARAWAASGLCATCAAAACEPKDAGPLAVCCNADVCEAVGCVKRTPHPIDTECKTAHTCYVVKPYADGGVRVYCVPAPAPGVVAETLPAGVDESEIEYWAYSDGDDIYAVTQGIGGPDGPWFTARRKPWLKSVKRVKSKSLPDREKRADAQLDLDDYADRASMARCCAVCGCIDGDCSQCFEKTGEPCSWVAPGLCSACESEDARRSTE